MKFVVGTGPTGDVVCDLTRLVDTRLLVQANSGGGKSYCIRRLLEQTHGHVQHLVLDPEGEFASLRERYDYVLAARHGGDTAADPRAARLLAERLLELGVSAILDIYELKAHDRIRFVRGFLEALIDAPKKLWHPALVVVDEAHVYAPQQGDAESAGAVIDLATRGRKRGYTAVLATQRLSKLHKDAAAELNNKLIGRTGLDVDVKRAADELGLGKDRWRELRELHPGQFFAFGPALSRAVTAVRVGPVTTTHPKAGARLAFTAPPPTERVRALLPKLADLPAEAEERQRTVEDLRREVVTLKRALTQAEKAAPAAERVEVPAIAPRERQHLEALAARIDHSREALGVEAVGIQTAGRELAAMVDTLRDCLRAAPRGPEPPSPGPRATHHGSRPVPIGQGVVSTNGDASRVGYRERALTVIATLEARGIAANAHTLAAWLRVHRQNGALVRALAALRAEGVLAEWTLRVPVAPLPPGEDTVFARLTSYEPRVLAIARDQRPASVADLAAMLGVHRQNGALVRALSHLRRMGVLQARGAIVPTEALFR